MGRRFESCTAPGVFCQEVLTHTQPTTLKPPHLNIVHFARDHLSIIAEHDLGACVPHVSLSGLHISFVDGHHPSSHAGAQRVKPEPLSVSDLDSCGQSSRT